MNTFSLLLDRGYNFIKDHLRMQDVRCYWKRLLKKYAKLLNWKPVRNKKLNRILPEKTTS